MPMRPITRLVAELVAHSIGLRDGHRNGRSLAVALDGDRPCSRIGIQHDLRWTSRGNRSICSPSTATIRSPTCSPASRAGESSAKPAITVSSAGSTGTGLPKIMKKAAKMPTATAGWSPAPQPRSARAATAAWPGRLRRSSRRRAIVASGWLAGFMSPGELDIAAQRQAPRASSGCRACRSSRQFPCRNRPRRRRPSRRTSGRPGSGPARAASPAGPAPAGSRAITSRRAAFRTSQACLQHSRGARPRLGVDRQHVVERWQARRRVAGQASLAPMPQFG